MRGFIIAFISLLFITTNLLAQKQITVIGKLKGIEDGVKFFLLKQDGNVGITVSKDSVVNGQFKIVYTPDNENVEQYSLMAGGEGFPSMSCKLWAKAGSTITIQGHDKLIYTWTVKSNIPQQKEWAYFINANKKHWTDYQQFSMQRSAFIEEYRNGKLSKDEKTALKKKIDEVDSLSDLVNYKIQQNNLTLLQKGKITPIRLDLLNSVANSIKWNGKEEFRPAVQKMYNNLSADLKNSADGQKIGLILNPPTVVKVGQPMFDTLLKDPKGNTYHLADFKGKYILLDFWSFGCGPCHESVPEMKEIHEQLKDSLTIVGLNSDTQKIWAKATAMFNMTWYNLSDEMEDRGIYAQYGVNGIPNYVLIDPQGKIKANWTGYGPGSLKEAITQHTGLTFAAATK